MMMMVNDIQNKKIVGKNWWPFFMMNIIQLNLDQPIQPFNQKNSQYFEPFLCLSKNFFLLFTTTLSFSDKKKFIDQNQREQKAMPCLACSDPSSSTFCHHHHHHHCRVSYEIIFCV